DKHLTAVRAPGRVPTRRREDAPWETRPRETLATSRERKAVRTHDRCRRDPIGPELAPWLGGWPPNSVVGPRSVIRRTGTSDTTGTRLGLEIDSSISGPKAEGALPYSSAAGSGGFSPVVESIRSPSGGDSGGSWGIGSADTSRGTVDDVADGTAVRPSI